LAGVFWLLSFLKVGYNIKTMPPKKILVIEDSPDLADSLVDILNIKGYQTRMVSSGLDGVAVATSWQPDLILLDLKLPDIGGYEVLKQIQDGGLNTKTKVLILTASDTFDGPPENVNIASEDILHKPHWGIVELATRVETELSII
jgi:DNA-binding response OmpR family regulator